MRRVDRTPEPSSGPSRPPPRRYTVSRSGERVLIGLSAEETREFEQVAHLRSPQWQDLAGKRWFALYAKHERGWRRWLSEMHPRKKR